MELPVYKELKYERNVIYIFYVLFYLNKKYT